MEKIRKSRKYLRVTVDMDSSGFVMPKQITWDDGRIYKIDGIRDFHPANSRIGTSDIDCYFVLIQGQERCLYFERLDEAFAGRYGRWYVEVQKSQ